MTNEVWKPVVDYEEYYEVSNLGRVRSIANRKCVHGIDTYSIRKHPKIMKFGHNQYGHLQLNLTKDKQRKTKMVHRLVAEAFIPKPEGKDYINHKDYDPTNNVVGNLEWCTQKENVRYSADRMKHPKKHSTNTGEHHISYRKEKRLYRVCYAENGKRTEKLFKNLEEAVAFRNEQFKEAVFAS